MRSRVVCSLFAAVLYCVVSVTTSPLPTPSPMPPAPKSEKSAEQKKAENIAKRQVKLRLGLRTGFGKDDDWLMLTEGQEKRKQAIPLVCFAAYFCIGYDKVGGVRTADPKVDGRRHPVAGYYVELPMTISPQFRPGDRTTYPGSTWDVPTLLKGRETDPSTLNSDNFIPIVVTFASQLSTAEDIRRIEEIILNSVYSLKKEVVPGVKSKSTGRTVSIWVGLFRNKEPLSLGAPLEERKEADPAVCYGTSLCLYYGKDGTVHKVDMVQRARLPAQGFYKELPVVISNSIRRSEDRKTSFEESMKDVASLLQTTKEPTSSLNQKSYIPITVKSNRELLSPALSETDFEEKVLPEINRIVESLVSEDTSENAFPQSPNESTTQNMDVDTTGWSDAPEQPRAEAMHMDTPSTHEQSATHDTHMPGGQGSSNNKAINHSDWKSVMLLP